MYHCLTLGVSREPFTLPSDLKVVYLYKSCIRADSSNNLSKYVYCLKFSIELRQLSGCWLDFILDFIHLSSSVILQEPRPFNKMAPYIYECNILLVMYPYS